MSTLLKKHNFDTVFDSQKIFRLILEAMSNPSRGVNIKEYADKLYGDYSTLLAVAMTLLDNEVSFHTCENRQLSDEIVSLTLSRRKKIDSADFIFVCEAEDIKKVIESAKCGTLADPHKSATVIIKNEGELVEQLKLSGPGINGCVEVQATQIIKDAVVLRDKQYYEYPQGIDLIFISGDGELIAIPRLVTLFE